MEITLTIAGKETRFKKTGGTMKRYKALTGREWFADLDRIARMQKRAAEAAKDAGYDVMKPEKKTRGKKSDSLTETQIYALSAAVAQYDSEPFFDMLYIMAREADSSIPDTCEDWLDTFDDFPFLEVWASVSPMLTREMAVDPKNG